MMKTATTKCNGVALMVMMLAALSIQSTPPAHAEDSHVKGTMVFTPIEERGVPMGEFAVMASGAAEDMLQGLQGQNSGVGQRRATHVG